jgi:putative DNA primase/helicase
MPNKTTAKTTALLPLTIEQYAKEKRLPVDYLTKVWGLKNVVHDSQACIEQPYTRLDGVLGAPRYRFGNAKKSPYASGAQIFLYGQAQLVNREGQAVVLVEGESDTQTLHFARYNVLGIPGTSMWNRCTENDPDILRFLDGRTIAIVQEPPSQAEQAKGLDSPARMIAQIRDSLPLSTVVAVKLWKFAPRDASGEPLYKDVSGLWLYYGGFEGVNKFYDAIHIAAQAAGREANAPQRSIDLIRASGVNMILKKWLWPLRIPLNKVTVFSGMAERGKSTVAADFISRLTRGTDFPDCKNTTPPCEVVMLASEEDYDSDIKPRLVAAHANTDKVWFAQQSSAGGDDPWPIALDRDLGLLRAMLTDHPAVKLIVVDPVSSYIGNVDPNRPKEVRPFIDKLKAFAKDMNVSVLLIMHFSKNPDVAAIHRAGGAATWTDAPRAVWMFDKKKATDDAQDVPDTYVMVPGKLNQVAADKKKTLEFQFTGVPVIIEEVEESIGAVLWGAETSLTMDEQFARAPVERQKTGPKPVATAAAKTWLLDYLAGGAVPSKTVLADGDAAGHNVHTLRVAQQQLGIRASKVTVEGKAAWEWSRPEQGGDIG